MLSYTVDVCAFFSHYSIFSRTPGGTRAPGWESLHQLDTNSQLHTENSRKNPVTH